MSFLQLKISHFTRYEESLEYSMMTVRKKVWRERRIDWGYVRSYCCHCHCRCCCRRGCSLDYIQRVQCGAE